MLSRHPIAPLGNTPRFIVRRLTQDRAARHTINSLMAAEAQVISVQHEGRECAYTLLASLEELKKTGQLTRWVNDHDILLYEYEGEIKALSNICRHFGGLVGYP